MYSEDIYKRYLEVSESLVYFVENYLKKGQERNLETEYVLSEVLTIALNVDGNTLEIEKKRKKRLKELFNTVFDVDIAGVIFSYLDIPTLTFAMCVSKLWNQILSNDFLWKSIFSSNYGLESSLPEFYASFHTWKIRCKYKHLEITWLKKFSDPFQTEQIRIFFVFTKDFYTQNTAIDLIDWTLLPSWQYLECGNHTTIEDIKQLVFYRFGWKPGGVFQFIQRKNKTFRPQSMCGNEDIKRFKIHFWWFTERAFMKEFKRGKKFIFLKHFNPTTQSTKFLGYHLFDPKSIINTICTKAFFYEEITPKRFEMVQQNGSFIQAELSTGDILYVQKKYRPTIKERNFIFSHHQILLNLGFSNLNMPLCSILSL